jgi:hypothetical protein
VRQARALTASPVMVHARARWSLLSLFLLCILFFYFLDYWVITLG